MWTSLRRALVPLCVAALASAQGEPSAQVTVNGRPVTHPQGQAVLRQGRLWAPVVVIAEALGDLATVDPAARTVTIRRANGVVAEFRAATGEVLENGTVILVAPPPVELIFPADPWSLRLPVEFVSALLAATAHVDPGGRSVVVSRDLPEVVVSAGRDRGLFDVFQGRYAYNANGTPSSFNHNLNLTGDGRFADGLLGMTVNLAGGTNESVADLRYLLLRYDRPDGQRFMAGDVVGGGDLSFLSSAMRGAWYRQPVRGLDVTTWAGMARSGAAPDPGTILTPEQRQGLNFDTPVVGAYFTLGRDRPRGAEQHVTSSTGGTWFNGPDRRAGLVSTALRYQTRLHTFQTDLGYGVFEQLDPATGAWVRGTGVLLDATESITPTDNLTLVAGFTHVPETFVAPQTGGLFRPMNLLSGGLSWRATSWLTTSVAGRHVERLEREGRPVDYDVTATAAVAESRWLPSLTVTHSEGVQAELGPRAFTLVNLAKRWEALDAFVNLSRQKLGANAPVLTATVGAGGEVPKVGLVRGYQSLGNNGAYSGGVDISVPAFFTQAVSVGGGIGYAWDGVRLMPTARASVTARLPAKQLLLLTVNQSEYGATAFLELSGPFFERPGPAVDAGAGLTQLSSVGAFSGRVFQDVDLDGRFDPAKDRALPGVRVLLDGNNATVTEEDGQYRLSNIKAGSHSIYLDLLTVRADLSLLSGAQRQVMLLPERDAVVDFVLTRTGRLSGYVFVDEDEDGAYDDGEPLLGDVRIVTGNRDTLTNSAGDFVIGDLPQGTHTLLIDAKTLPEGMRSVRGAVEVKVTPPGETRGVALPVHKRKVEIEIRQF